VHISLKQMRYAVAVARVGHFGRAAELCAISQPALSQQIQALEELCGASLFDRLKRGVSLTPFGREFIDLAQRAIESADAVEAFANGRNGALARPLRFGLIPTVAPYLLPDIFPALRRDLPDLRFTISENRTDALLAGLFDGSLDLALIATQPDNGRPRLTMEPLFHDGFVLATSAAETAGEPVALGAIDGERMLLLNEGHCFRDQAIAACGIESNAASSTFAATSLSTIVEFVANGQGITLLPEIALRKEATDRIQVHRLAAPGVGRMLSLCWRDGSPFAAVFRDIATSIRRTRESG
jgi:LysR family hydrogen peroxide-inducible transcriptional activator